MAFTIFPATTADAPASARVHLEAMDYNLLMHAQFPSPQALLYFREWLERDALQHIKDEDKGMLVARGEDSELVAFIKWTVRGVDKGITDEEDESWPGCRLQYLDGYAALTARTRESVIGDQAYYHITFLCTSPSHSGKGAASALLRELQNRALTQSTAMPLVLESTMSAVTFYERIGFQKEKRLNLMLPERGSSEETLLYEEVCMVWRPTAKSSSTRP